ncbi:DNA methylase [Acetobacter malorum]|uniref:site-specific DNA-methyltransferase (adenine-specific) n=1 Tax=Acetobacter malorum TaxID=178901 RepID=A0A149RR22_9PROT|nr:site-specific DNA-methyltransferase [Acetobacter malorum]KXV16668.1 DNA methylase [Acetobacter malorum]
MPILEWMTRDADIRATGHVSYRLLQTDGSQDGGNADPRNMLIQGDNLDALKALLPYYAGSVKCIYIDPPYNTKSAFEHYDDNLEHAQWLAMIYPRLVLLRDLLAEDGSIWVSIDDNEGHYLKVIMDEVFGRKHFISNIIWQKIYTVKNSARHFSDMHEFILCYSKNKDKWKKNNIPRSSKQDDAYKNPDNDIRGAWKATPIQARNYYSKGTYSITTPSGRLISAPPPGTYWRMPEEKFKNLDADNRIWWGEAGKNIPAQKRFLSEVSTGVVPASLWLHEYAGHNAEAKNEVNSIFKDLEISFLTPKPERLIQRILHIATNPGDLVLDSFLGSGTTAAVAHKMGRRWIGIEMGDHALTHCKPRMDKVIAGEQGGISEAVGWQGGGGYRFCTLGAPVFDEDGRITPDISFPTLAAHIWFSETGKPYEGDGASPVLGTYEGVVYALLYNGILGDRKPRGGNVLTNALLQALRQKAGGWQGPMVIYGESSRLGSARLADEQITFRQTPYDVRAR